MSSSAHDRWRRPNARWVPIARRRRPTVTGRGSRLCASACSLRPAPLPHSITSAVSSSSATCATVSMPTRRMRSEVAGPTPHSASIGSGWRKASSPSGGTTSSPSGLQPADAILATNLVGATPTEQVMPCWLAT